MELKTSLLNQIPTWNYQPPTNHVHQKHSQELPIPWSPSWRIITTYATAMTSPHQRKSTKDSFDTVALESLTCCELGLPMPKGTMELYWLSSITSLGTSKDP